MYKKHPSVLNMWSDYLSSIGESIDLTSKKYSSWYFDNNEKDANELAELVKGGEKRATATSLWCIEHNNEPMPKPGEYIAIINWNGIAQCIIQTTKVSIMPFDEVPTEFAFKEGEGDKSLSYWRKVHKRYFTEELQSIGLTFSEHMPVICEEFEVVF